MKYIKRVISSRGLFLTLFTTGENQLWQLLGDNCVTLGMDVAQQGEQSPQLIAGLVVHTQLILSACQSVSGQCTEHQIAPDGVNVCVRVT